MSPYDRWFGIDLMGQDLSGNGVVGIRPSTDFGV